LDDIYRINVAITEFREAYNTADIDRLLAVLHEDFVDMSEEFTSGFGVTGKARLRARVTELVAEYSVKFVPIIIDIVAAGDFMFDFCWHEFTLTPKLGGEVIQRRRRYFELWQKNSAGAWKIKYFMNNSDVAEVFNGQKTRWFRSEDHPQGAAVQ
jgi:ketosteroid isomerase-like protein